MFIPSSSTVIICCCCILMIFFLKTSCAYVVDSNELTNSLIDQKFGLNIPSYYYDRNIRATKFPRIGRSSLGSEEISSLLDVTTSTSSEENSDEDNQLRSIERQSVHFPRIGKRAFHNLLWANSRSNPHRMLDSQGRHHTNGYDYHIHQVRPQTMSRNRAKRNILM